jgi:hypothetical protein
VVDDAVTPVATSVQLTWLTELSSAGSLVHDARSRVDDA